LATLGEIAAGSCAQELLRLDYHPKILDLIALHELDVAAAAAMVAALEEAARWIAGDAGR
jgi:hypothetical protein